MLFFALTLACAQDKSIILTTYPKDVYIVNTDHKKLLNVDIYVENKTSELLTVTEIKINIFDQNDKIVLSKNLENQGVSPGLLTIPKRSVSPNKKLCIFNPFHSFEKNVPLDHVNFEITLTNPDQSRKYNKTILVSVKSRDQLIEHILPLKNLSFISDGNDFYSHHRRFDFTHFAVDLIGIKEQSNRYGYDFRVVNEMGEEYINNGINISDWFTYAKSVYSTASGTVVDAGDGSVDSNVGSIAFSYEEVPKNPKIMFGNYIIIQHADSTYSSFFHLKNGSVKVHKGDTIEKGQLLGKIGNSGDSFRPHLHYHLSSSADPFNGKGLPIYFSDYNKIMGDLIIEVKKNGYLQTGEFVKSN